MAYYQTQGGQAGAYGAGGAAGYGGGGMTGGAAGYGAGGMGGAGGMQAGGMQAGGMGGMNGMGGGGTYAGGGRGGFVGGSGSAGGAGMAGGGSAPGCCGIGGGQQVSSGGMIGGAGMVPGGAGIAAGGCMGTGCEVGCDGATTGSLAFVGNARGDWVTETTYKYVGMGAGDLTVVTMRRALWPWLLLVALLIAAVLAVLFWPSAATTTTIRVKAAVVPAPVKAAVVPAPPPVIKKSCIFWGDPHLVTFDGARPSFYGDGEFWIVKSRDVHIQGRYMGTKYTYGLAATQKVAIGGPFLDGHSIEIEPMEHAYGGKIMVDGTQVLESFGRYSVGGGVAEITYSGDGELVDEATSKWTTRAVHMDLPRGIRMTVFRWGNYLDLKITMPQQEDGQDGSCGNFNGDMQDDSTAEIFKRIGARVSEDELMFARRAVVTMTHEEEMMLTKQCPRSTLRDAKDACDGELPSDASEAQVAACAFDYCFGMVEHALPQAKEFATEADRKAAHTSDLA